MSRPLIAQKVATPAALEEQLGSALLIECYRIGNTAAIVTRENVAAVTDPAADFRWHLSLAHPERRPTWEEFEIGMKLLPDDQHYGMAFPHSGYAPKNAQAIDIWELHDGALTERWEYDSVVDRPPE